MGGKGKTGLRARIARGFLAFSAAAAPAAAMAQQTIGDVANRVNSEIGSIPSLLAGAAFLIGVAMLIKGLIALREHSDDPKGAPLPKALMLCFAGSLLIALPSTIDGGVSTLFRGEQARVIDHG